MAKSSSFFGLRTGSTKSLTFQVLRGQQITKDRVARVANPRTDAQMQQRALIPMVASARSVLKGLINHSFEGIAYGEPSLRYFSSVNLKKGFLMVNSYAPYGFSNPGFADYLVSKGSLPQNYDVSVDEAGNNVRFMLPAINTGKAPSFPAAEAMSSANPLLKALGAFALQNNISDLLPDTQTTFLVCYKGGETGEKSAPTSAFAIIRFLVPSDTTSENDLNDVNGQWRITNNVTQGDQAFTMADARGNMVKVNFDNNQFTITVTIFGSGNKNHSGAAITSRLDNGVWRRSTARLSMSQVPLSNAYTFTDWSENFRSQASSNRYLNQGSDPVGIRS